MWENIIVIEKQLTNVITGKHSYIFPENIQRTNFNFEKKINDSEQVNVRLRFKKFEEELLKVYDVEARVTFILDVSHQKLILLN